MYAIVKFFDEEKTRIVMVKDIRNFDEQLIMKKKFLVKFTDGFYYSAQVVVVKDTIEELESYQERKRLQFVNNNLLDSATSAAESETEFLEQYVSKKKKSFNTFPDQKESRNKVSLDIFEKKLQKDLLVKHKKNKEKEHQKPIKSKWDRSQPNVVNKPLQQMHPPSKNDLSGPSPSCNKCSSKLQVLEGKIKDLKMQNKELSTLNIDLQKTVIGHFAKIKEDFSKEQEKEVQIGKMVNNQVHLGRGVYISKESYNDAWFRSSTGSQFVKSVALYVFGSHTLANSSVTRKSSNYYKKEAIKPALDATKLAAIEDIFKHFLKEKHPEQNPTHEIKLIRSYISNKISDLNRTRERKRKSVRKVVETEKESKKIRTNTDNSSEKSSKKVNHKTAETSPSEDDDENREFDDEETDQTSSSSRDDGRSEREEEGSETGKSGEKEKSGDACQNSE